MQFISLIIDSLGFEIVIKRWFNMWISIVLITVTFPRGDNSRRCHWVAFNYWRVSQEWQWPVTSSVIYNVIKDLESIDHLCINPFRRIGLIRKWSIDSHLLKWSVQVNVFHNNCKQSITSLSLLVGTTVETYTCLCSFLNHLVKISVKCYA